MHVGLIGGIGPAATDFYYRSLIEGAARKGVKLELTIAHADSPTLLSNLASGAHEDQSAIYSHLTDRLVRAGADCVVVTSISGHFCIDTFTPISPLPVINLMSVLGDRLSQKGCKRVGILGTRPVMETGMYGKLSPVDVIAPQGEALDLVHQTYVDLALSGRPKPSHREVFFAAGEALTTEQGAEAVLLGGTDLNVTFEGYEPAFPTIDCAAIHVDAIVERL